MSTQARYVSEGNVIPYTFSGDKSAGDVVVVTARLVGIVQNDVDYSDDPLGSLIIEGVVSVPKITGAITVGDEVYWDADGNPVSGTAGTGAATTTGTNNAFMGFAVDAPGSSDTRVQVKLVPNSDVVGTGT